MCVYKQQLVLFGGFDGKKWLNDLHQLNTAVLVWEQPKICGLSPTPRQYHAAAVLGDYMYVHGGFSGTTWLRDFHVLDFVSMRWISLQLAFSPPAKEGHTFEAVGDILYCFGGWDGAAVADLHCFNTITREWQLMETEGPGPARCGHSMTAVEGVLFVYGGFDGQSWTDTLFTLDTRKCLWVQSTAKGQATPRGYHSAVRVNQFILMFGGYDGQFILGDLVALDTVNLTWSVPDPCFGRFPLARNAHTMSLVGSELYLFGGYNGTRDVDNLDVLETAAFSTLREDLRSMSREAQWKDVLLRGESCEREVHALVLRARAPGLYGRLSPSGEISLQGCSRALLEALMEFLYCDLSKETVTAQREQLLDLAVRYDLVSLKAQCCAPPGESQLTADLAQALTFADLSDLELQVESETFHVHKCVLAARCPYFKALFTSGMQEAQSSMVTLHDISARAMRSLLEWLYFDKFEGLVAGLDPALGVELLCAASRLLLPSVLRLTETALLQQLSSDTAVPLFEVAFVLNAERLKCYCLNLMLREFDRVSMKIEFAQLSSQALAELTAVLPTRMRRQTSQASRFHCDLSMVRWEQPQVQASLLVHSLRPCAPLQVQPHNPSSSPIDPEPTRCPAELHSLSRKLIFGVRPSQCQQLKHREHKLQRHKSQPRPEHPSFLVKGQSSQARLRTAQLSPARTRRP
jgi:hypothetical protein